MTLLDDFRALSDADKTVFASEIAPFIVGQAAKDLFSRMVATLSSKERREIFAETPDAMRKQKARAVGIEAAADVMKAALRDKNVIGTDITSQIQVLERAITDQQREITREVYLSFTDVQRQEMLTDANEMIVGAKTLKAGFEQLAAGYTAAGIQPGTSNDLEQAVRKVAGHATRLGQAITAAEEMVLTYEAY
jgi:hypothetical protein